MLKNNLLNLVATLSFVTLVSAGVAQAQVSEAVSPESTATSGGAVTANYQPQMPDVTQKGTTYSTGTLSFTGASGIPSTATTTSVAWTWAISNTTPPAGLVVQLCNTTPSQARCLDISSTPHGSTTVFGGNSLSGGPKYEAHMLVPGSGVLRPALYASSNDQVILNYQY